MYRMFNSVLTFVPLSSLLANDAGERLSVDFHVVQMCILERYIASQSDCIYCRKYSLIS